MPSSAASRRTTRVDRLGVPPPSHPPSYRICSRIAGFGPVPSGGWGASFSAHRSESIPRESCHPAPFHIRECGGHHEDSSFVYNRSSFRLELPGRSTGALSRSPDCCFRSFQASGSSKLSLAPQEWSCSRRRWLKAVLHELLQRTVFDSDRRERSQPSPTSLLIVSFPLQQELRVP